MSDLEEIIRLAAKGDGVTKSGRHVPGAVTGDKVDDHGEITPGQHHAEPACNHFGTCGGCQLQHANEAVLREFVRSRVVNAAKGQDVAIGEVLKEHLSPPHARRRATLHALRTKNGAVIGFREGGSHKIVDLAICPVLRPELMALTAPLRSFIAEHGPKGSVDIVLSLCDQGVDIALSNFPLDGLGPTEGALDFASEHALARLSVDQGFGPEAVWEPEPVTVTFGIVPVNMPIGAFLQATQDAEDLMVNIARDWLKDARLVADLFSGLGTFAFGLVGFGADAGPSTRKVLAAEADQAAHLACKSAAAKTGGKVITIHRDLFRNPVTAAEIGKFDAALLDPPRAGAKAQIAQIAESALSKCLYVSCNPSSWARDAAVLTQAGFKLTKLLPVGQFRWSTHVELVSLFER